MKNTKGTENEVKKAVLLHQIIQENKGVILLKLAIYHTHTNTHTEEAWTIFLKLYKFSDHFYIPTR